MPRFNRKDGQFIAYAGRDLTFAERRFFANANWQYEKAREAWVTTNYADALELRSFAVGAAKEYIENTEMIRAESVAGSMAEDYDGEFPCPEGLAYLDFQKAGIAYALDGADTLIADPPGLGKTVQAIGVHNAREAGSILIVCTASLKINWSREWQKWDVHGKTVGIAGSKARSKTEDGFTRTWTDHIWPDTDVVIINYDMLETFDKQIKEKEWDLFIADECHHLKGMQTVRTKCVFGGRKKARKNTSGKVIKSHVDFLPIRAKTRLFLTGTPILSRPAELWVLLRACDPDGLGRSYDAFVTEFCAAEQGPFSLDVSGSQNEEKLQELLRSRFMVRRDKKSVLKELPDKLREIITLPHDKLKKPLRKEKSRIETALSAYEAVLGLDSTYDEFWYISAVNKLTDKLGEALDAQDPDHLDWEAAVQQLSEPDQIMFTEISAAREEVALAKVGMVVEHVAKLVDAEEPVILFAYHKSVIAELKEQLEKLDLRVGVITGATPANKRQGIVDQFQDGELDVILGNIIAMGEGYTITRARFVVFAELDWVPAKIEQAEDRAWRIGQVNAVLVQHLVVDGSIEARMVIALLEKMMVIAEVLDAKRG